MLRIIRQIGVCSSGKPAKKETSIPSLKNMTEFYTIGGTLPHNSPAYVERQADRELKTALTAGEFAYVLTSRQMGKSSLMVRTARNLRKEGLQVAVIDCTAVGQNLSPEQWYNGLLLGVGRQLNIEDELDIYWTQNQKLSPVQRWFRALQTIALPKISARLVVFIDEIDAVKSLPFHTDEFFAAIRECYNRRIYEPNLQRLAFCLLGVTTPHQLIANPDATPFHIGRRIQLHDFTKNEAQSLSQGMSAPNQRKNNPTALLDRILYWTHGHPYLTQKLCRRIAKQIRQNNNPSPNPAAIVDPACETLFLAPRAREQDDNLLFVREKLLRNAQDLSAALQRYNQVRQGDEILDDETDETNNHLLLFGIVRVQAKRLVVRNRIYHRVFNQEWTAKINPLAEIELPNGKRVRIQYICTIGRTKGNDIALPNPRVSRRHAVIQSQSANPTLILTDMNSRNGVFLNGKRISQPALLRNRDRIGIGPFQLTFLQSNAQRPELDTQTTADRTVVD